MASRQSGGLLGADHRSATGSDTGDTADSVDPAEAGAATRRGPRMTTGERVVYSLLTVTGLSFWFFLGFPYANHNESFAIVAQLREMGFADALTQIAYPVANYRPLGQAVAWLGYRSSGTITSVQVFNYVVAVAAWLLLLASVRERRAFAVTALLVGGVFFTGYIYLFHLHGVFYSPLLLLVAAMFWADRDLTRGRLLVVAAGALVAAFFHPYALVVLIAALAGMALERRGSHAGPRAMMTGVTGAATALLVVLVVSERRTDPRTLGEMFDGLLVSYRMVEVNPLISVIALGLAVVTALTVPLGNRLRFGLTAAAVLAGAVCHLAGLPMLLVWIAVCLVKAAVMKKWWIALVLVCAAAFPAPTATGSPTYTVFALMVCCAVLPYGCGRFEERIGNRKPVAAVVVVTAASVLLVVLRFGVDVPVISRLSAPLVAEQQKTFQMEEIVRWLVASGYDDYDLRFVGQRDNPTDSANAVDRVHRPPTNEGDLARYVQALRGPGAPQPMPGRHLMVGFGSDVMPAGTRVLVLPSGTAGDAVVVLPDR
ncbi:hypothetical protein [Mycobacterium sp. NPDC050041]|uniref:hypothetical protein n=1 Tax=Mycobacterium sp. NPDC050041 TaxID=3364293 RepID=UPI003C2C3E82